MNKPPSSQNWSKHPLKKVGNWTKKCQNGTAGLNFQLVTAQQSHKLTLPILYTEMIAHSLSKSLQDNLCSTEL